MNASPAVQLAAALRGPCHMTADALLVVGVSGGRDSIALLNLLHELKQPLIAAVFDHRLRTESAEEAAFVQSFCRERGFDCRTGSADVSAYAREHGLGIEAAARELRYGFLFRIASENGAAAVCTAHHANDRAETVLMHLLRGTGIDGLAALRPFSIPNPFSDSIPLIRPLLGVTRPQIEAYIDEQGLPYREDRSNADTAYTRNRVRAELIPALARDYNPEIVSALCRLAETASADADVLAADTDAALGRVVTDADPLTLARAAYMAEAEGIRLRLLRKLTPGVNAGYENLKALDEFILSARRNATLPWMGNYTVVVKGVSIYILKNINIILNDYPQYSDNLSVHVEWHAVKADDIPELTSRAKADPWTAYMDAEGLSGELTIRTAIPGERVKLYGGGGQRQKLSDFWVNRKLPQPYRENYPVVADEFSIVWLPGFMISERGKITERTREIVIVKIIGM